MKKELKIGLVISVERWDGNGSDELVEVVSISDNFIQFDKGYCKFGKNIIWEEANKNSSYWQDHHCFIDWDKYYIKDYEV